MILLNFMMKQKPEWVCGGVGAVGNYFREYMTDARRYLTHTRVHTNTYIHTYK